MKIPNWSEPIIHVGGTVGPCRLALVTGISYNPLTIHVAVYRFRGDHDTTVLTEDDSWHSLKDCPRQAYDTYPLQH